MPAGLWATDFPRQIYFIAASKTDSPIPPAPIPRNLTSPSVLLEPSQGITTLSPEYEDLPPSKIVPLLADKGQYLASESTFYNVLREEGQLGHRHHSKPPSGSKPRGLAASAPNCVYSWDITRLPTKVSGMFFYLYMVMDIYSRKIVGWQVYGEESSALAAGL